VFTGLIEDVGTVAEIEGNIIAAIITTQVVT